MYSCIYRNKNTKEVNEVVFKYNCNEEIYLACVASALKQERLRIYYQNHDSSMIPEESDLIPLILESDFLKNYNIMMVKLLLCTLCDGCESCLPNQEAHMDCPSGCLHDTKTCDKCNAK